MLYGYFNHEQVKCTVDKYIINMLMIIIANSFDFC